MARNATLGRPLLVYHRRSIKLNPGFLVRTASRTPLIIARDIAGLDPKQKNASLKDALEVVREFPLAGYAVLTIALSHMVMVSVMSMTPAHLNAEGHSLADVGFTISLHIAGMYALSPVFGWLTDKFGAIKIVITGQLISLTSLAVSGFWQSEFYAVVLGLFLLGLGWVGLHRCS